MALGTLTEAQAELALWDACVEALSTGQSYTIAGRTLTRVELPHAIQGRTLAQRAVASHQAASRAESASNLVEPGFKVARWSGLTY